MSERKKQLIDWLESLGFDIDSLHSASEDASFRRYFRVTKDQTSYIVMDAPPQNESCVEFVDIAEKLRRYGVNAPEVIEQNMQQGFLVLSDFGDVLLLSRLNLNTADQLYRQAMDVLLKIQKLPVENLPDYSAKLLLREVNLFDEWFLQKRLQIEMSAAQSRQWDEIKSCLVENALQQPKVFVHRDYHSRNIMLTQDQKLGILDFQDAVKGPVTYDLVSILRDCYINWSQQQVRQWLYHFYQLLQQQDRIDVDFDQFFQWFNLMGIQRHLKAIGIFSRLKIRDGKNGFIKDIPRTFQYIAEAVAEDSPLEMMQHWLLELDLQNRMQKAGE